MAMTRTILVSLRQQIAAVETVRFLPRLAGGDNEIVLNKYYDLQTDSNGAGSIELPVSPNGTIKYEVIFPARDSLENHATFHLSAGSTVRLEDLLTAGTPASDSVLDFIQTQFQNHLDENDPHPQYLNNSRGDARYLQKTTNLVVDGNIEAKKIQFPFVSLDFADNPKGWDKSQYLYAEYYFYYKKGTEYFNFHDQYAEIEVDTFAENYNIVFDWENDFEADSIEIYRYDSISDEMGLLTSLPPNTEQFVDDNSLPLDSNQSMPTVTESGNILCNTLAINNLNLTAPLPNISVINGTINNLTATNVSATNITANGFFKSALNVPILIWNSTQLSSDNFGVYLYNTALSAPANKTSGFLHTYLNITSAGTNANIRGFVSNIAISAAVTMSVAQGIYNAIGNYAGTITELIGEDLIANQSGGTITNLIGSRFTASHQWGGALTSLIGGLFRADFNGSITSPLGECGVFQLTRLQTGTPNITTVRGISIRNWSVNNNVTNSYGIYIDNTIDRGTVNKYCIYSESTADSQFMGNMEIADPNKNYIVRSPNNNRWKLVVDDSGNLTAQAA